MGDTWLDTPVRCGARWALGLLEEGELGLQIPSLPASILLLLDKLPMHTAAGPLQLLLWLPKPMATLGPERSPGARTRVFAEGDRLFARRVNSTFLLPVPPVSWSLPLPTRQTAQAAPFFGVCRGWVGAAGVPGGLCCVRCSPAALWQWCLLLLTPQVWSVQTGLASSGVMRCVGDESVSSSWLLPTATLCRCVFAGGGWRGDCPHVSRAVPRSCPGLGLEKNHSLGWTQGQRAATQIWSCAMEGAFTQHPVLSFGPVLPHVAEGYTTEGKYCMGRETEMYVAELPRLGYVPGARVCTVVFAEPPTGRACGSAVVPCGIPLGAYKM